MHSLHRRLHLGRLLTLLLSAFLLALVPPVAAQEAFAPDRPGLGTGATVLAPGQVIVELGLPEVERADGDLRDTRFPALLRVGVTPRAELRLGGPVYNRRTVPDPDDDDETLDGFGDVEIGLKISFPVDNPFFVTDVALLPSVTLPVGEQPFAADRVGAGLSALGDWLGWWAVGFNTTSGLLLLPDEDGYRLGGQLVVTASRTATPWLSLFAEGAYYPTGGADNPAYAGGGLTLAPLPNVQLDAFVDAGLTDASAELLYGAGLAVGW